MTNETIDNLESKLGEFEERVQNLRETEGVYDGVHDAIGVYLEIYKDVVNALDKREGVPSGFLRTIQFMESLSDNMREVLDNVNEHDFENESRACREFYIAFATIDTKRKVLESAQSRLNGIRTSLDADITTGNESIEKIKTSIRRFRELVESKKNSQQILEERSDDKQEVALIQQTIDAISSSQGDCIEAIHEEFRTLETILSKYPSS